MGQTPDEIQENIARVRARMTETIRDISLTAEIRRRVHDRIRSNVKGDAMSVDEALDRLPMHQPTGDHEVDPEIASRADPSDTSGPISPGDAARRGRALLAIAASMAAGILAGLASMKHPVRPPRDPDEEESQSPLKGS
ncbi:MAG: hypothetical protein K0R20_111 [Actinomycetia bacterium]|nr:hypothetical protein [Actinomycetes bacterium]